MIDNFFEKEKIYIIEIKQSDVSTHDHDFLELVYVVDGSSGHALDGIRNNLVAGDYFIVNYGSTHEYFNTDDEFRIINLLFMPVVIDGTLAKSKNFQHILDSYLVRFGLRLDMSLGRKIYPTDVVYKDVDGCIYRLLQDIGVEVCGKLPGYMEIVRCKLIEIIIKTVRTLNEFDTTILYDDCSRFIANYVEENYMKPIKLSELSRSLGFSIPYMSKKFKEDVGTTFTEYLQKTRIEHSCRLISNTNKKIEEIAALVGYHDMKSFNSCFRKYKKTTPGKFRKIKN